MASVATLTPDAFPNGHDLTLNHFHIYGTVALAAGTYPVNGIPLNWGATKEQIATGVAPSWAEFQSQGSPPGIYEYVWDSVNDTLRILQTNNVAATGTAPFSEFPFGYALPPLIVNDMIGFHAVFRRS